VRIEFLGELSHETVLAAYSASHIVIIPSLSEGIPNVLYEAMATGNMVIATNVGGIAEVLEHHQTGILIEPNNAQLLAAAILEAVGDINKIREYAVRARIKIQECTYGKFIASYIDLYGKITARYGAQDETTVIGNLGSA
jgi:glycosyltransferase involved in cell wall biosynthesis